MLNDNYDYKSALVVEINKRTNMKTLYFLTCTLCSTHCGYQGYENRNYGYWVGTFSEALGHELTSRWRIFGLADD